METKGKRSCGRVILFAAGGLIGLCLLLAGISALANQGLPRQSPVLDRLSDLDKIRAAEIVHLRRSLGAEVLPGWDQAEIPMLFYNEEYAFLVGLQDPPDGWQTVPGGRRVGGPWEQVPDDTVLGEPYYRQRLEEGVSPQNFTVQVGSHYTANLMLLDWFRISIGDQFREDLPAPLKPIFPYRIAVNLFMPGSDRWATAVHHEAVHAYQGLRAAGRLEAAELAGREREDSYPFDDPAFQEAWQVELNLLNEALRAGTEAEMRELAGRFVAHRSARRDQFGLPADLIEYERCREWAEGIAKYGEFRIYALAATAPRYEPLPETVGDPEFHRYESYTRHWNSEVEQIRRMADDVGDGRFYYSGMAQAVLLDRLAPGWKERLFDDGVWLEDLLAQAVQ